MYFVLGMLLEMLREKRDQKAVRIGMRVAAAAGVIFYVVVYAVEKTGYRFNSYHVIFTLSVSLVLIVMEAAEWIRSERVRRLITLIRQDISYYAMHTNYDTRGMADLAAGLLKLDECTVLEEVRDGEGIGRVGLLPRRMTLEECAGLVKKVYDIPSVRLFGPPDTEVRLAAVCPGAGKSTMKEALRFGCDVYITGDIDHHTGIDAVDQGLCIIDAGHYGIEHIFMKDVRDYLEKVLAGVRMECVPVKHPFTVV